MAWKVTEVTDDAAWFHEAVSLAVSEPPKLLPPPHFTLGQADVSWFETEPGIVHIEAHGGSPDDRELARSFAEARLAFHGFRPAQYTFDWEADDPLRKTATWDDIMSKAKRLIDSGNVSLLRNGYNTVVANVTGDHGQYQTEIARDDPSSRVITQWTCECNDPHNSIVMADGSTKAVKDIRTGDLVLTATGHVGVVGRTMSREYSGRMVGLTIEGATDTVWLTDNHKLITADIEAKEAGDWRTGDYSYLPQPQVNEQRELDVREFLPHLVEQNGVLWQPNKLFGSKRIAKAKRPKNPFSPRQKPVPAQIALDENFARLGGLFIAEGIATARGELRWSFNAETEIHLANEVIERLKVYGLDNAKKKEARHCLTVAVQSKPMADLFCQLFGTGSRTKKLHPAIMSMNREALRVLFDAWVEGDGCITKYRTYLGTASDNLAMQARLIMARLGHESVIRRVEKNTSPLVPNGGSFNQIAWRSRGGRGNGVRWFENDHVTQMMCVEEKHYEGTVYNFEVVGEHSYVLAPGIASLNCPWDQFAFNRTRQWKKYEGRPCAHVLATYWLSLGTPLDEDIHPGNQGPGGPPAGPGGAPGGPGGAPAPAGQQMLPVTQGPAGALPSPPRSMPMRPTQQPQAPMTPGMQQPPGQPDIIPPFPMDQMQMQMPSVSIPGFKQPTPANPLQYPGGTFSSWRFGQTLEPESTVQLNNPDVGIAVGKSDAHGNGEWRDVPQGALCEVVWHDPTTDLVNVRWPLRTSGPLEPFHVEFATEAGNLTPRPDMPNPFAPYPKRR